MIKCKRCGVVTGPVFGLCARCVQKEDADLALLLEYYLKIAGGLSRKV